MHGSSCRIDLREGCYIRQIWLGLSSLSLIARSSHHLHMPLLLKGSCLLGTQKTSQGEEGGSGRQVVKD